MAKRSDSFLADDINRARPKASITLMDGFRFGFGATIGLLLVAIIISGLAWLLVMSFHLK